MNALAREPRQRTRLASWFAVEDRNSWIRPHRPNLTPWCVHPRVASIDDLSDAIETSRNMLSLPDDWDDEGSPEIREETWRRATDYLRRHAELLYARYGLRLPIPRILAGPAGSVDLHWKINGRELLLNVPATDELATFYGDASGSSSIKGTVDTKVDDLGLFTWLTAMD
jgi:hypothetical protein